MSNESQTPEGDNSLDLSGLNFGPAWARDPSESKSLKKFKNRGDRDDSRARRGGPRHKGGGGRRQDGQRGGGDQRGGGKFKGGRGRNDDRRPRREEVPAPEGFKVSFMPIEESLDLLAKEVTQTGRTYSVFDLAKVLLQGRDRFRVAFEHPEKKFFRCREDNSLWLTKEEALRQLWRSDWISKYYTSVQVEVEVPSGSFSAVAKCGFSGRYLGPPNYHAYQQNLASLHREQFSNMTLEQYKSRIVMENGEDAVAEWLESMKTTTQWKIAVEEEVAPAEEGAKDEPVAEESGEPKEEASAGEKPAEEALAETPEESSDQNTEQEAAAAGAEEKSVIEAAPVGDPDFKSTMEVEQHFLANHFNQAFEETTRAWVLGDIKGKFLSPGLLTLLKNAVTEEKRYPATLMPFICRQLSGRHVAVFKWQKKLKVGPSRPHAVPEGMALAERPQAIIDYLKNHSGKKLEELWQEVFPKEVSEEEKAGWYHDLHWLLNQGYAVLLCDTTIHLSKNGEAQEPQKKAAKKKMPEDLKAEKSPPSEQKNAGEQQENTPEDLSADIPNQD